MHDKVYNRASTESNIGSRKICMDELVFLTFFVPPATPLPSPALEMDTQDAGVTLIHSIAKLKLLKLDARSLYFERASYFAKLNLPLCQTVFKSCSCQFLVRWFMVKGFICAKVVWQNTMILFWFDFLFFN